MKKGIIYIYTAPNGKSYVGQTWREKNRKLDHYAANGRSPAFHSAIKKYGKNAFTYRVLYDGCETQEELNRLEIYSIKELKTLFPNGYNLTHGGEGGRHIEETKQKIRQAWVNNREKIMASMKEASKRPEVHERLKQNAIRCAADPAIQESRSKKLKEAFSNDEIRKERSKARKSEWADPEIRKKRLDGLKLAQSKEEYKNRLSEIMRERWLDPEYRKSMKGKLAGKKRPQSAIDASRKKRMVPVLCVETGQVFESAKEAGSFAGVQRSSIAEVIGKPGRTSGGYTWEYANDKTKTIPTKGT